ncbi:hypothetical protein DFH09DRAFT_1319112 [Mycena vulgaris]|nr:hypothetical protein DFH09DRAFT_1319112 [Mycena vulgaris]
MSSPGHSESTKPAGAHEVLSLPTDVERCPVRVFCQGYTLAIDPNNVCLALCFDPEFTVYQQRNEVLDLASQCLAQAKEIQDLKEAQQKQLEEHTEANKMLRRQYESAVVQYQDLTESHQRLKERHHHLQ